ncbi:MAG TPA: hypothetical protein VFU68_08755 [Terracidiphilus sp.]|nr:hypothetical protein [Terracidiphilus sp.]
MSNESLNKSDTLYIEVTQDCNWCYTMNPAGVFSSFLPAGSYTATTPPTTYGPYTAAVAGTVNYNAVTSGDCSTAGITATVHSITVS